MCISLVILHLVFLSQIIHTPVLLPKSWEYLYDYSGCERKTHVQAKMQPQNTVNRPKLRDHYTFANYEPILRKEH